MPKHFKRTLNTLTKFNGYSYGVQLTINFTALDQSELSHFVECTIRSKEGPYKRYLLGCTFVYFLIDRLTILSDLSFISVHVILSYLLGVKRHDFLILC
jgi:hypothetical protein